MQRKVMSPEYGAVLEWLAPQLKPWRKLVIAIDGFDGVGKSSLARFLAWQTGMPTIETDLLLDRASDSHAIDNQLLSTLVAARHRRNRPVIVEGVMVLQSLRDAGLQPDLLIRVVAEGRQGSITWQDRFARYRREFPAAENPDYRLVWIPAEQD